MIKSELKELAFNLFEEGTEPREVLEALQEKGNVNRSTVYRWRNEFNNKNDHSQEDSDDNQEASLSTEEDFPEPQRVLDSTQLKQLRKKKRTVLKHARRILRELLEFPSEGEFPKTELEKYLDKFEGIQDEIEDALDYDSEVFQQNYLWNVVTDYVNKLERLKRVSGNPISQISYQDLLSLRDKLQLEIVLEVEELDEPYYLGMEFIGLEKSFLIELINVIGSKTDVNTINDYIDKLDRIVSYASQNLLSDDFKEDLKVLNNLRKELSELEIRAKESGEKTMTISDSLLSDIKEISETTIPIIQEDQTTPKKKTTSWAW